MRLPVLLAAGVLLATGCVQPVDEEGSRAGNRPPVITAMTASPPEVLVGTTSLIAVTASDPDNDPLTYSWSASTGDIIGEGSTVRFSASFCCAGPNVVRVTVRDNAGGSASFLVDVLIAY